MSVNILINRVIIVVKGIYKPSSNPRHGCFSFYADFPERPVSYPPNYAYIIEEMGFHALLEQQPKEKEKI